MNGRDPAKLEIFIDEWVSGSAAAAILVGTADVLAVTATIRSEKTDKVIIEYSINQASPSAGLLGAMIRGSDEYAKEKLANKYTALLWEEITR